MLIRVGLEYGIGGRTLAWGLDFPGCFAFGEEDAELMLRFAKALLTFEEWVRLHTDEPWFQLLNPDFRIVEAYHNKQNSAGGEDEESRAAFEDDLRPLEREEITNALQVFRWQREELLAGLEFLPARLFEQTIPGGLENHGRGRANCPHGMSVSEKFGFASAGYCGWNAAVERAPIMPAAGGKTLARVGRQPGCRGTKRGIVDRPQTGAKAALAAARPD